MSKKLSAGILVYRQKSDKYQVLLAHPGGPFWANKDRWSIPKGETESDEDLQDAAKREFKEETGLELNSNKFAFLGAEKQGSSKINHVWAVEAEPDLNKFFCKSFTQVEWPPKSGNVEEFPEVDRINWFGLETAKKKLFKYQVVFIEKLAEHLVEKLDDTVQPEQTSLL